ncbi:extracellular solute-binding protein [Dethiothermospora halolimnae]|uniref:extracellular solute-binding protein n=1 Tax=Dethiothermospora halolimnae TaxID=3114390 RepID=UPI003CCBC74A
MKKVLCIIFSIMLLLASCTNEDDIDSKKVESTNSEEVEDKEITIAVWDMYYYNEKVADMAEFDDVCTYNGISDIIVEFDVIRARDYKEFLDKLNVKLYLDEGPTLIRIPDMSFIYKMFKEKGIAEKIDNDKVPNINNIYDFYLEDEVYFVPIGARYLCTSFNKGQIEKLNIEMPNLNLTADEYYDIRKKWVEYNAPIEISWSDVSDIVTDKLNNMNIFSEDYKAINIDTKIMRENIKTMKKEIYSGKYILPNDFTYEDYYKACFDFSHQDRSKYEEFRTKGMSIYYFNSMSSNGLKTASIKTGIMEDRISFPNIEHPKYNVDLGGFIVNKNGKNKELGYKFLNRLLGEEFQMKMYKGKYTYAPVIKTVEDDIDKIESEQDLEPEVTELKNYIHDKMEKGEIKPKLYRNDRTLKTFNLRRKLYKDLFKFIFTEEEYSDEELSRKLKELEDRYSVYLNE